MARAKASSRSRSRTNAARARTRSSAPRSANARTKARGRRAKPAPRGKLTVRDVATHFRVTTQAVYNWIKRGELKVTRVDGRYVATRTAVRDMERYIAAQWAQWSRPKDRPLTDDEFLQALWDSDPD